MHIGNDSHARACAVMQLAARFNSPRGMQRLFVPSLFCHFKMRKPLVLKQTHLNAKYMRKGVFKTHLARLAGIKNCLDRAGHTSHTYCEHKPVQSQVGHCTPGSLTPT